MSRALYRTTEQGSVVREHGALGLLLLALVGVRLVLGDGMEPIVDAGAGVLGRRTVVAGVYAALVFTGITGGYYAVRVRSDDPPSVHPVDLVRAGVAVAAFVGVWAYAALGSGEPSVPFAPVLDPLVYAGGLVVPAVVYARYRGVRIRTTLPTSRDWLSIGAGALCVAAGVLTVLAVLGEPSGFWSRTGIGPWPRGGVSARTLVERAVVPAVAVGAGSAVLFNGVVQETLREYRTPAAAAGATAAMTLLWNWGIGTVRAWFEWPVAAAALVAGVAGVVALGYAYGALWDRTADAPEVDGAGTGTVVVAAALGAALALAAVLAPVLPEDVGVIAWMTIVGTGTGVAVAAVLYERTRTVWAPALVVAVARLLVDPLVYDQILSGLL